jgi:hypothetical protein
MCTRNAAAIRDERTGPAVHAGIFDRNEYLHVASA